MLTDAEAREQLRAIRALPAEVARHHLNVFARHYQRLVFGIALQTKADLDLDDKVQWGWIGWLKASRRFDLNSSTPFHVYATWVAKREIQHKARDQGRRTVRVPASMQARARKVAKQTRRLAEALGASPSEEEVANACGLPVAKVRAAMIAMQAVTSLDEKILNEDGDGASRLDFMPSGFRVVLGTGHVRNALVGLEDRHRDVAIWLLVEEKTREEVGVMLGVSRQRAQQILNDALSALRISLTRKLSAAEKQEIARLARATGVGAL